MLKYIVTKDIRYNGQLYRGRKIIAHKDLLTLLLKVPEAIAYSGWRSLAEQKKLVAAGKSKTLNSNHRRGTAVDVINWKEVESKMRKLGLINDISWDRNHFALGGESQATKYPLIDVLPKVLDEHGKKNEAKKVKKEASATTILPIPQKPVTEPPVSSQSKPIEQVQEEIVKIIQNEVKPTFLEEFLEIISNFIKTWKK